MLRPHTALAVALALALAVLTAGPTALLTAGPSYAGPAPRGAAHRVVGHGTPGSCTAKAFRRAVAKGGVITFDCGPHPVTIVMDRQAEVHKIGRAHV